MSLKEKLSKIKLPKVDLSKVKLPKSGPAEKAPKDISDEKPPKDLTYETQAATRNGKLRLVFVAIAFLLELTLFLVLVFTRLGDYTEFIMVGSRILAFFIVLGLLSQHKSSSIKIPWVLLIMLIPLVGCSLYLFIGLNGSTHRMARRYEDADARILPLLRQKDSTFEALRETDPATASISFYIMRQAYYPLCPAENLTFYADTQKALEAQIEALSGAKKFIFMEYHAIEDASVWHRIQDVLERKVQEGVEVRVFYDDIGSIGFINTDFAKKLRAAGIACRVFNPVTPLMNLFLNNRDHRKITVVDGEIGFTGGYNIAEEYFNITSPYGHWKDTGVRFTGNAVNSLTASFLEMWNASKAGDEDDIDFAPYFPAHEIPEPDHGFLQPYADNPMDDLHIAEDVYIALANRAQNYLYIMTPYLIITDEMSHALGLAAKRGVDVRIVTPGIPDKKLIYQLTRSYYHNLTLDGVRIYEYTPGFCHAKMCVTDDAAATCGTINYDYRSLYHHFENGCLMAHCDAVLDIRRDFENTFPECREVTEQYRVGTSKALRIGQLILRIFAPLL